MAVRTIAELKSFFQGLPRADLPTAQQFSDLFDTLQYWQDRLATASAGSGPIFLVADEAALLAAGPGYEVGQRVKRQDNGRTYVKQEETGDQLADFAQIGDADIVIGDVDGLTAALAARLVNNADDTSPYRMIARNWATPILGEWELQAGSPAVLLANPAGAALSSPDVPIVEDIELGWVGAFPAAAQPITITGVLQNEAETQLEVSLGDGMSGNDADWPITLAPGQILLVTLTFGTFPSPVGQRVIVESRLGFAQHEPYYVLDDEDPENHLLLVTSGGNDYYVRVEP